MGAEMQWPEDEKIAEELMAKSKQAAADAATEAKENQSRERVAAQSLEEDNAVMPEPDGIMRVSCAGLDDLSVPFILSQMPSFGWDCMCVPDAKLVIAMQNGADVAINKSDHLTMIIKLQHALEKSMEEIAEDSGRPTLVLCPTPISTIADVSTLRRILGKEVAARPYDAEISFDDVLPAPSIAGDTTTPREYGALADLQRIVEVGNNLACKRSAVAFNIETSTNVLVPPDALWEVMGNFADACIKFENVPAAKCDCVGGNQIGAVRTLSQIPGLVFTEELLVRENMTISYNIQNTQGDSMMNCKDLVALYRITADGEGSRVDWSVEGTFLGPLEGIPTDGKPPWATLEGLTAHIKHQYPKNVEKAAELCNLPEIEVRLEEDQDKEEDVVGAGETKVDVGANVVVPGPHTVVKPEAAAEPEAEQAAVDGPGPQDMTDAKILYVKLKAKWDSGVDGCPTSIDDLKAGFGDGGLTKPWSTIDGLRHKYFTWNGDTETVSGIYVFFNQAKVDAYTESDLFKSHEQMPYFSSVEAEVIDVMSGTELSIEKTPWPNTPPSREDISKAFMLIVEIKMKYDTGIEGLPTKEEELRSFMSAAGTGYPRMFGDLEGLRGKYFGYKTEGDTCYGFYTFVNRASLDAYMASDLFTKQGEPPHIGSLTHTIHEVLPGTEICMDLGAWTGR